MRSQPSTHHRGEQGFILLNVVLAIIIASAFLAIVIANSVSNGEASIRQNAQTIDGATAEGAIQLIQQALEARREFTADEFELTAAQLATVAQMADGVLVPSSSTAYPSTDMAPSMAVQLPVDSTGLTPYWQIVKLRPPDPAVGQPNAVIIVRAWHQQPGSNTVVSASRAIRAELRPGTFADYQIISDVGIQFEPDSTINGRVHSNGFLDGFVTPPIVDPKLRIWDRGPVTCEHTAGLIPVVTTSSGTVRLPEGASACKVFEYTGRYIDIAGAQASFERMKNTCSAGSRVYCFDTPALPNNPYKVLLAGSSIHVQAPTGVNTMYSMSATQSTVLYFTRDVEVRGTFNGRLTIATRSTRAGIEAGDIRIVGNVSPVSGSTVATLGLLAESDIEIDSSSCVSIVKAAMVAMTGAITLPREDISPIYPGASVVTQCPNRLTIEGSIVSHMTPVLRYRWGANEWTGYDDRRYLWDYRLRDSPPPLFPLTHTWEISRMDHANGDCYGTGAGASDPLCK